MTPPGKLVPAFLLLVLVSLEASAQEGTPLPERGFTVMLGTPPESTIPAAKALVERNGSLVCLLAVTQDEANTLRLKVQRQNLGGRIVVGRVGKDGSLPFPDRFVNLLICDADRLGQIAPSEEELRRVLAVDGMLSLTKDGQSQPHRANPDENIDGWFSHWYDAAGNCLSQDQVAGFPRSLQWQHGPALEDGTADGKIVRIADGRIVFLDNLSAELVCRDAGNGRLAWKKYLGSPQNSDVCIAGGRVHVWFDPDTKTPQPGKGKEAGWLTALDLQNGNVELVYKEGVRAGTAASVEIPWAGRTRRENPVPWFVVTDQVVVQAYGPDLVVLERRSGKRLWSRKLDGATWFSPTVSDGKLVAAEAVYPARRMRNNGSDFVRAVTAFSLKDGEHLWRNEDAHPERTFVDSKTKKPFTSRASFKTMSATPDLVLLHCSSYQFRDGGSIAALDPKTGKERWRREFEPKQLYTQGSQRPVLRGDEVVLLDGTGAYRFDARTGEPIADPVKRPRDLNRTGRRNGACTGSRATVNWLMANAWLFVGPDGKPHINQAARSACGQGLVPANGLVFATPTPCDCGDYLRGYLAMAPRVFGETIADEERLTNFDATVVSGSSGNQESSSQDWPIFLGNLHRTSATDSMLPDSLKKLWSVQAAPPPAGSLDADRRHSERYLGALSAPVVAHGVALVAAPESHQILAFDSQNGRMLWAIPTAAKVDSPPTIAGGLAVFGCDDGSVNAVRLSDGASVWRFAAAPTTGRSMLHSHLASSHPVPGSVLILGKTVIAIAGQHTDLGGLHVWALDLATGQKKAHRVLATDAPPALANNITVADRAGTGFWIVSPSGGSSYGAGGAYHLTVTLEDIPIDRDGERPAMTFDRQGTRVRFRTQRGRGGSTHGWKGAMRSSRFFRLQGHRLAVGNSIGLALSDPDSGNRAVLVARNSREKNSDPVWQLNPSSFDDVESLGALALAGSTAIVGGGARDGSAGHLFTVDVRSAQVKQTLALPARVTECGLAIARGRLYVACEDGSLHCFGK